MTVARIAAIKDPHKRAARAQTELLATQAKAAAIQDVRDATIQELIDAGERPSAVARLIGVGNSAISNRFRRRA